MPDIQYPWLSLLAFGLSAVAGACFAFCSRTLAQAGTGDRRGQLLIDGCLLGIAWSAALLLAWLAFSPPAMISVALDLVLFSIIPLISCTMLALHLIALPPLALRSVGAAAALAMGALLTPLAGALASDGGLTWNGAPEDVASAALLAFATLLPATFMLAQRTPAWWRSGLATLSLAAGWLLPSALRLVYRPTPASSVMSVAAAAVEGLGVLIALDALVVIGLLFVGRRLLGRSASRQAAELAELRAAKAGPTGEKIADGLPEQRCGQLLESANVGFFDWDLLSGDVRYGGAWARMLGYDRQHGERFGQSSNPLLQLCHPGELRQAQRLLLELSAGKRERAHCELRLRAADDAWHWVSVNAQAVEWQPDGTPRRVLGSQVDINRIKRLERILLAERSLFTSGPVSILSFDAEPPHRLRQASSNLQAALGHPEQRPAAGQPLDALLHPDDVARLAESVLQGVGQSGTQIWCEVRLGKSDGSWHWYLLHIVAEHSSVGNLLHAYLLDIHRLKEAESHAAADTKALQEAVLRMGETQHFRESLQQLTELLQLCENEAESEQIIVQGGPQLFPRWSGALTFADDEGLMTVAASWGQPFTAQQSTEADCWAVRRGRLHQSSIDPEQHALSPVCNHFRGDGALPSGIKHTICAPLLKSLDRPGVLHLVAYETMDDEDLRAAAWRAETFADALKLSLGNLRLRTSLHEQAVHDEMTDLYNRRYFDEVLKRELSRAQRTGEGMILAILDIDHFKNFNDSYGHEAGDEVLKKVADQLRRFVRTYDIACRIGGEELAIIMPRVHIDEATGRLNQLREEIGAGALTYNGKKLPAVTVSIGVADLDSGSPEDLPHRADSALYAAKNGGRNRVMRWSAELDTGQSTPAAPARAAEASGQ